MLEDDVGVCAAGHGDGGSRGEAGVGDAVLALGLLDLLLRGRVSQRHGDGHAEGRLGLVEGAQRGLVVVLQAASIWLDVVAALGLAARKGRDGQSRARGSDGGGRRHAPVG